MRVLWGKHRDGVYSVVSDSPDYQMPDWDTELGRKKPLMVLGCFLENRPCIPSFTRRRMPGQGHACCLLGSLVCVCGGAE